MRPHQQLCQVTVERPSATACRQHACMPCAGCMDGPSGVQCWQCIKSCMAPLVLLTIALDKIWEPLLDFRHVFKLEGAVLALQGL